MAFFACLTIVVGRTAVGAFHMAKTARAAAAGNGVFGAHQKFKSSNVPFMRKYRTSAGAAAGITSMQQSTVAVEGLEKSLDVSHPAFETISKDIVSEYGAYCTLYKHKKSGAELLSVSSDDDNKVFGITFRTPPSDSTGVPHILEHSVLCGSRKYKTKDPFVQLLQGSLQTFLNAFTYPDRTCYVVASQNTKDFYNLVNVYTDAVFHPRAISDPMVHAQEGWHLELENKEDPLTYKGVVYNEMKGVYSSPDSLLMRQSQNSIFPDNTYAVDSGGDPKEIPNLSFDQFAEFHAKFYHPGNSRIFFSGDDDVYKRLELMDEYLNEFDASPESKPASVIEWQQKSFSEPKYFNLPYPAGGDQEETHMVNLNWLINDRPLTATEDLTLGVLDRLLMGTSAAILRKTLMESGLGSAITGGGLSDELLQATFSIGLKGVKPDNTKDVEKLVLDTLEKAANEGFSDDAIAAAMNTIEFQLREFNTGSFPKGLSFMLASMSKWLYDQSPTEALKFEEPLAELKASIKESGSKVFQDMIRELLLTNSHRSVIEMVPSKTLDEELLKEEQDRLAGIKSSMKEDELEGIIKQTVDLKALQGADDPPEARATIPSLELSDLKRDVTEYPIAVSENEDDSGVTVVRHELGSTSGIAYVNFGVDLSKLPLDDVVLLPLFTRLMKETGAGEYSDIELSEKIGIHTGGVDVDLMISEIREATSGGGKVSDGTRIISKMFLSGKSTTEKIGELFSIFKLLLTEAKLDSQSKVVEMLKETKTRLESSIQGSGHAYANTRLHARYHVPSYIKEKMGGISYLETVKNLLKEAEEDWPSLLKRLETVRDVILDGEFCRDGMVLDITGEKSVLDGVKSEVEGFLKEIPGEASGSKLTNFYEENHPWVAQAKAEMADKTPITDEGFVVSTQVSYVGKGGILYDAGESVKGSDAVVSNFLRTGYLWDHVRVMGGAYGGFCTFSPIDGFFSFLSYRDPNLAKTLDVYDAASDALMAAGTELEKDQDALASAIIGTIGDMDQALSPDQKGYKAFQRWILRESPEQRQKYRDELLNTKPSDFVDFAKRLKAMKTPSVAVISSKSAFEAAADAGKSMSLNDVV